MPLLPPLLPLQICVETKCSLFGVILKAQLNYCFNFPEEYNFTLSILKSIYHRFFCLFISLSMSSWSPFSFTLPSFIAFSDLIPKIKLSLNNEKNNQGKMISWGYYKSHPNLKYISCSPFYSCHFINFVHKYKSPYVSF